MGTPIMQFVSDFLERFQRCLLQRDSDLFVALNMPDDLTGWGLYEQDEYNGINDLLTPAAYRKHTPTPSALDYNILDVFGNGDAVALICDCRLIETPHNGQPTHASLRVSFYLIKHHNQLKIRHAHFSKIKLPSDPVPETKVYSRSDLTSGHLARLHGAELSPFLEWLNRRTHYVNTGNVDGILGLQHPSNSSLCWASMDSTGGTLRGKEQYHQNLLSLQGRFNQPRLKYRNPVVFRNDSLACISAYVDTAYRSHSVLHTLSNLRVTHILQKTAEQQWLSRHSHWSLGGCRT